MFDQTAIHQLKHTLRKSIDKNEVAGANIMLIKDGREIFYHQDGMADRDASIPISRNSIFRLYSLTKPITATSVMILLERGEIDLYDPVSRYLPGFNNQMVEKNGELVHIEREVHIHDLLSMTSGLVYGGSHRAGQETEALFKEIDCRLLGESPMSTLEVMNRLGQCPLAFQPGSYWQYGTSADVLGAIVEVVSGMRFGEFLQRELFEPLYMKDTGFWLPEEKRGRLVKTYADNGQGGLMLYTGNHLGIVHQMDRYPAFESGGAGLVSTIDDVAQFTTMLMNKGRLDGNQILRPRTVQYLTSATLNGVQQKGFESWHMRSGHSYGNLMRILTDCRTAGVLGSLGEYGWDGWLGAYFGNFPQEGLTFLFMIQKKDAGTTSLTRKLRNIVLSTF
ncbi:serine hydrolase domain-containing protein [Paenibacillus roseipurpureus]|uniref:Serine hydrolase domain-containing protein n=1 Tax=Paenibacillus roseopurpureus TaxID=2918901 RepID=A0AA96LKP2_9BACL|nr:serine hydrolase domain-containing protein [Paenibacillus sp. MBLB1832]WNR42867.1 serine hydrolase domain-containing protein [Paenibacillus sp. MBLB1832]